MVEIQKKERAPASISVAGLVPCQDGRLLLTVEEEGKIGLPGGGIEPLEDPFDTLKREFSEETGLDGNNLDKWEMLEKTVVMFAEGDKTRIGIVIATTYKGELPNDDGWKVDSSISIKPFSATEILELLKNEQQIRRPEFNVPQLTRWLITVYNKGISEKNGNEELVTNLQSWIIDKMEKNSFGIRKDPLNDHYLTYLPPHCIIGYPIMIKTSIEELGDEAISIYSSWSPFR